jgi:omega-amidase
LSRDLHIVLLQMDITLGEPAMNYERLQMMLEQAVQHTPRPDVIVFPEMWNTGYALDRLEHLADHQGERTIALLSAFAREYQVNLVAGSIADKQVDQIYNQTYVFNRAGEIIAQYAKIHLFRLMDEHQFLTAGELLGTLQIDGIPAGMMICYDIRFPELSRVLALGGAQILFVPAQWPHPRLLHWRSLLIARAIENQMYVVACNRVGKSGDSQFFGHSMVIDPWGEVMIEGTEQEEILHITIDLDLVQRVRKKIPIFADRRPQLYL